jgi:hypothetical protein
MVKKYAPSEGTNRKTAFHCRYGLLEYQGGSSDLANAPFTFPVYMNNIFRDCLDKFVVYLIFS